MPSPVTLQISLAPTDFPHAQHLLPHQLRTLAGCVDEVLLVVDLHRSPGRFSEAWEERRPKLEALIEELCAQYPNARREEVDYSDRTRTALALQFFAGVPVPLKDSRGGPFHSYLFGLHAAKNDYVFHLDSDMLLGGGSRTWVDEALAVLAARAEIVTVSPLPGPPMADGRLRFAPRHGVNPDRTVPGGLLFRQFSTRIFLADRSRLGPLKRKLAPPIHLWRALRVGNPPYREPENLVTRAMHERGQYRLDFLGRTPGLWSLHPKWRSPEFYAALPEIIARVERGDVPEAQRGDEELNDSMVDWSSARAARRR